MPGMREKVSQLCSQHSFEKVRGGKVPGWEMLTLAKASGLRGVCVYELCSGINCFTSLQNMAEWRVSGKHGLHSCLCVKEPSRSL